MLGYIIDIILFNYNIVNPRQKTKGKILEIGAGTGNITKYLLNIQDQRTFKSYEIISRIGYTEKERSLSGTSTLVVYSIEI